LRRTTGQAITLRVTTESPIDAPDPRPGALPWARHAALAAATAVLVLIAGSPALDAPWLPGDEYIFLVDNPDVNPAVDPSPLVRPLPRRLAAIFAKVHDDLYQPIPIATYALEWALTGGDPLSFRRTDLLIQALNALLLWWVLHAALTAGRTATPRGFALLAWTLATLWALHPMLVTTWAADMGRTHLLSATFALLTLRLYLLWLQDRRIVALVGALLLLIAAMLCKPIPGWVLLALALEAAHRGWRQAARQPAVWIVALICGVFAALTYWTSRTSGLMEDASRGLFGDPLARSALAVWIYFRNLVAPLWLSFWYLPDPRTGWSYPWVWVGLALAAASVLHAVRAWKRPEMRSAAIGWAWCWALLLPVIGLVGARESAAVDRYMYQPLMGIALVVGALLCRALWAGRSAGHARVVVPVTLLAVVGLVLFDMAQVGVARSPVRRARRLVELNRGDPRALEALAVAYEFARRHPLSHADATLVPTGKSQVSYFTSLAHATLTEAAATPGLERFFPRPADRGPFHRRLAYRFLLLGDAQASLAQAEQARQLLPGEFLTWRRLAHAYQAVGRYDDAVAAYQQCEALLATQELATRAAHFTDYGTLLMYELDRDQEACTQFQNALETGKAPLEAKLGWAVCQIRYGEGAAGFRLIVDILETIRQRGAHPIVQLRAGLALGEYRLRSHHWDEAYGVYKALLQDNPTEYAVLRGFHEACFQSGRIADAVTAWRDAVLKAPGRRELESFLVWAMALSDDDSAARAAEDLMSRDADNPMACLGLAIVELRSGRLERAVELIYRSARGTPVPKAREFERAVGAIQILSKRSELSDEAVVALGAIYSAAEFSTEARSACLKLLDVYLARNLDDHVRKIAQIVRDRLSDLVDNPTEKTKS